MPDLPRCWRDQCLLPPEGEEELVRHLFDEPEAEPGARLEELEAKKVCLFEELGRVAQTQKELAAQMRRVEREQRAVLDGIGEHVVPDDRDLTHADIEAWCESVFWSHARTMLGNPHQYALRKRCADPRMYERIIGFILRHGRPQVYGRRSYTVLDVGLNGQAYFLWPMTDDPAKSEVLNAKPASMAPEGEA
jgi:hypothetical protein